MSTELTHFDPNNVQVPAHILQAGERLGSNIQESQRVNSLSYTGKAWHVTLDGNKTTLQAKNSDGDMLPIPVFRGVVLNYNPSRGRALYEGAYDPNNTAKPKCWSADGKTPDPSSSAKQAANCQACPMAVKGSKISEQGKEVTACGQHRMMAVVPAHKLDFPPLRLKIAVTSDWAPEVVEHGWFAWRQYVDFLRSRGIMHTGLVVTKMKFDPNTAYPKLLFAIDRFLSPEEIAVVEQVANSDEVAKLLDERWTADGVDGTANEDGDGDMAGNAPSGGQTAAAQQTTVKTADPAPAQQTAPAASPSEPDDLAAALGAAFADEPAKSTPTQQAETPKPAPQPQPEPAKPAASNAVPDDVASLLADWGG